MRIILLTATVILISLVIIRSNFTVTNKQIDSPAKEECREICGTVKKGETLFDIFKRYSLDLGDLLKMREAAADIHRLRQLCPGRPYKITADADNRIDSFDYWIDDDNILSLKRSGEGFAAEKLCVEYERRVLHFGGMIENNLIESMGGEREQVLLAFKLSDIFAWDIDFTSDLRSGDTYKMVVEGYYLNGELRKYGEILSAEFANHGQTYTAYRFGSGGEAHYFDAEGRALKRAFLKAPLNFRRISSRFSHNRFHPILRINRPHHGLDYAAPTGAPVSAVGEGNVVFAGHKGQYGNLVVIRHPNSWKTYYGHLSKIAKGVKAGRKIAQGQVIGSVGSTGLATGPHLHYEVRIGNKPTNPLALKMPRGKSVPRNLMAEFREFKDRMDARLASINVSYFAYAGKN
ncbi:MAG: peptidoglycan DD-metalloendopeptidase family protein [Nitrospirota bacterium]